MQTTSLRLRSLQRPLQIPVAPGRKRKLYAPRTKVAMSQRVTPKDPGQVRRLPQAAPLYLQGPHPQVGGDYSEIKG